MGTVIALAQQKGGVGKTTTTINLGAALRERGHRILLADMDPQGALSAGLGLNPLALERTIYDLLRTPELDAHSVLLEAAGGLSILPANIDLAAADIELISEPGREYFLREKLAPVVDDYDYVLIDCQPSLGLLTLNALCAASAVIIPVETEYLALRGLDLLLSTIRKVQARVNPGLEVCGILATKYDGRKIHAREILAELQKTYADLVFAAVIPDTVKFADSSMAGAPVLQFSSGSPGAAAYRKLAEEVETRARQASVTSGPAPSRQR